MSGKWEPVLTQCQPNDICKNGRVDSLRFRASPYMVVGTELHNRGK